MNHTFLYRGLCEALACLRGALLFRQLSGISTSAIKEVPWHTGASEITAGSSLSDPVIPVDMPSITVGRSMDVIPWRVSQIGLSEAFYAVLGY